MSEVLRARLKGKQGSDAFLCPFVRPGGGVIFLPSAHYLRRPINNLLYYLYNTLDKFHVWVYDIGVKEGKAVHA